MVQFESWMWTLPPPSLLLLLISAYISALFVYRLCFHPLRHFPGDKLAALTQWHWDYYASTPEHLVKQHATYGPVVRISPNEVRKNVTSNTLATQRDFSCTSVTRKCMLKSTMPVQSLPKIHGFIPVSMRTKACSAIWILARQSLVRML